MIGNMTGGSNAMSRDIGEVIYRMKMLGFNAIRLPFTFAALAQVCALPARRALTCQWHSEVGHGGYQEP